MNARAHFRGSVRFASRWRGALALAVCVAGWTRAASPEPVPDSFGFSLLGNAFSKNPLLSMTVYTEMTPYGRTLPPASLSAPVYFQALDRGRMAMGETVGDHLYPAPDVLRETLTTALAVNGYLPVTEGHEPSLILIYYWGSHNRMDFDEISMFGERHHRQMLERAMLVGGSAFRQRIARGYLFGTTIADRTPKREFLYTQAEQDMYFMVVSAYDRAELAAGRRRLAWRTTMTVGSNGVSMQDAIPPLVVTAGEFFGRDTTDPVAITRRARRGTVTLGPMRIITDGEEPRLAKK
jgi:hypothetical protein